MPKFEDLWVGDIVTVRKDKEGLSIIGIVQVCELDLDHNPYIRLRGMFNKPLSEEDGFSVENFERPLKEPNEGRALKFKAADDSEWFIGTYHNRRFRGFGLNDGIEGTNLLHDQLIWEYL